MRSHVYLKSILAIASLVLFLLLGGLSVQGNRRTRQQLEHQLPNDPKNRIAADKREQVANAYNRLPLRFEANRGQASEQVKFISRSGGQTLLLTANEAVLKLQPGDSATPRNTPAVVKMKLAGANQQPHVAGLEQLPGRSNYFIGNDSRRWRTNVTNYGRVQYDQVYPGIDLVWHGNQRQLEYDFIVAPGANPQRIRLSFAGVQSLFVDGEGALVLQTDSGNLKLLKPLAWQEKEGQKQTVACDYVINPQRQIEFRLGQYDPRVELVIDPVLLYSSYLGGSGFEQGNGIALDKNGNIFVTGVTVASDFPGPSPIQSTPGIGSDVFVVKLNASGSAILYGTWLGGASEDTPAAIAVDQDGNTYVTGSTFSQDFPTTNDASQKTINGNGDAFVAKINAAGSALVYSTYLGGNGGDFATALALDNSGNTYLAGSSDSSNLPANGFQSKRVSNGLFKSGDRAANWATGGSALPTTQVRALTVDPNNSNTIYAGTPTGVFKSTDGGNQWQLTGQGNPFGSPGSVQVIVVDPTNSNVLYAGAQFGGLYKSTDGGNSYISILQGISSVGNVSSFYDILIDPGMPMVVYVGTNEGAFKSTNGGASWSLLQGLNSGPTPSQRPKVNRLTFDPANRAILYAATNRGVFKTTDSGGVWTAINNGLGQSVFSLEVFSLAVDPTAPNTLYASLASFNGALFKTTDGGTTWRASNTGLVFPGTTTPLNVNALVIDPAAPGTIYAVTGSTGVFKTTDGGATWNASNNGLTAQPINALAIDPRSPANLFAGTTGGNDAFAARLNAQGTALDWLTYLGGVANEDARGIELDKDGNVYLTGATTSTDFPALNPLQAANAGGTDAYIAKLNPTGAALLYATYFGGSGSEGARSIKLNDAGEIYIAGTTSSLNLPLKNSVQAALGGGTDAFVTKLNPAGSAVQYSTYLGGTRNENGYALYVDGAGSAYITGDTGSTNFPLFDAAQTQFGGGNTDVFVTKLSPAGSSLVYSTFAGGSSDERGAGIVVDSVGNAYVTGDTRSPNFPSVVPLQSSLRGGGDAFLIKLGIESDLAITKTVSRNPVLTGNNFNYVLTVTNNGLSQATGVIVTDPLPAGINFVSATASQGSCTNSAGVVTCNIGNLAVQAKASITLTVTPALAGLFSNTASVKGNEPDGNQTNNGATVQTTISTLPSIYGRVTLTNGNPLAGAAMSLTGAQTASQTTNSQGTYQFANLPAGGNYTVTPALNNYSFEPPSRNFAALSADQAADFTATVCAYSISPSLQSLPATGGAGTINVTATARCPWTATVSDNWITINSGASGAGDGMVSFTVAPATAPRSGRITVAGYTFVIYQSFNPCDALRFTTSAYPTSNSPAQVEIADFDGDNISDLAILPTLFTSGPLTVLRGEGDGKFTTLTKLNASTYSRAVSATDVNGDGKPDLLLLTNLPDTVWVYLNTGHGQFAAPVQYPTILPQSDRSLPYTFFVTDLNRDGRPDMVIVNDRSVNYPFEVSLLLNQGNGRFGAPIQISLTRVALLGVADLTGDGVGDLLAYKRGSSTPELLVFPGDGAGSFASPISSLVVGDFRFGAFGDFNNDSRLDVVMSTSIGSEGGGQGPYQVSLLLGDGKGRFHSQFMASTGIRNATLSVQDMNGDSKLDVLISTIGSFAVFLGDGTGRLSLPTSYTVNSQTEFLGGLAIADFNKDNKPDVAVANTSVSAVSIFLNECGEMDGRILFGRIGDRFPQIGFKGVTVSLSGAKNASTQTDDGGNYVFRGLTSGSSYTVTPSRPSVEFTPASLSFDNLTADQEANFVGVRKLTAVSAASYSGTAVAPDSIVALFGVDLSTGTEAATTLPLPYFLGGSAVSISPSGILQLFFASPNQINALMPSSPVNDIATLTVTGAPGLGAPISIGTVRIEKVVPGLFTTDASGRGLAAAVVLRVKADGSQIYEPVARFDPAQNRIVAVPIDLSNPAEQVFLLLFGTGFRNNSGLAGVTAKTGGATVETFFAGAQGDYAGLDQLNLRLPQSLAGRGTLDIVLTVDGKTANTVQVNTK